MKLIVLVFIHFISFTNLNSIAITNRSTDSVDPIVKKKIKKNILDCHPYKGNTLCKLIQTGNYKAVKNLILNGADINKSSIRLTPLMYAARHNRVEIVKLLIKNGANLKKRSNKGFTALNWAKHSNASESYKIIFDALKKKVN